MHTGRDRHWRLRVGLLGLAFVWTWPSAPARAQERSGGPAPELAGARTIVLPFTNISGDSETDWVGAGIAEALATDLSASTDAAVIGRDAVTTALRELGLADAGALSRADALAVARRAGAQWLVHGGYQQVGDQVRVTARIVDCDTGAVARTGQVDGVLEELFALQDQILPGLLVTETAPTVAARRSGNVDAVPPNPDAGRVPSPTSTALARATGASAAPVLSRGLALIPSAPPPPVPPATASRNAAGQVTVRAVRLTGGIALDGVLEEEIYRKADIPVAFVGHPLIDLATPMLGRDAFLRANRLNPEAPIVTMLPGSRVNELRAILPDLVGAAERIARPRTTRGTGGIVFRGVRQDFEFLEQFHKCNYIHLHSIWIHP